MIRGGTISWLTLTVVAAGAQLYISYQVKALKDDLSGLNAAIVREQEALRILRADWSYLTSPARLATLAETQTELRPASAEQILADIDDVPWPLAPEGALADSAGGMPTALTEAAQTLAGGAFGHDAAAAEPLSLPADPARTPDDPIGVLLIDLAAQADDVPTGASRTETSR